MYKQIIVDCQSKDEPHCEDCIAYKTCDYRKTIETKRTEDGISVATANTIGVWQKWKTRKSLPQ